MERAVVAAQDTAQPGDTVLLAPGCASMDMFANYATGSKDAKTAMAEAERQLKRIYR